MRYYPCYLHRSLDASNGGATEQGNTLDKFMNEIARPTMSAVDTPAQELHTGDVLETANGAFRVKELHEGQEPAPEPEKPMFTPLEPEAEKQGTTEKQTVSGVSFETFMKVRNQLQGQLLAMVAKSNGDATKYMLSEADSMLLAEAYGPYQDKITGMFPPWVMILVVEFITTGKVLLMAMNDRKVNTANEAAIRRSNAAAASASSVKGVAKVISLPVNLNAERTRFKIHSDGSYQYGREGDKQYYNKGEGEKVNLTNIAEVKQAIASNGWKKIKNAFSLTDDFLTQNGIDLENLHEE